MSESKKPLVGIIMGSKSDLETMKEAQKSLEEFGVACEMRVISAHRAPDLLFEYVKAAKGRGFEVLICGAGGAAHLPGVAAAITTLPVIGVPIESKALHGMDSLLSIVQMPGGIPVATVGIGNAKNAGILAARILSIKYPEVATKLKNYADKMAREVKETKI
ncbi:5-(carboxyamino)imidazole ribonucleotide mutase [Candidatus Micrarchaeota archaeon]|nr:5-(carboxyamino)imidazole ribonucleotide mutase [Candidatus Micrarchaeota archaeon]